MALAIATALKQQQLAADPNACVWVNASAGTGKTKVLTDRILALLLNGAEPTKILCLTFTKAAAAEMLNRLSQRLGRWVLLDDSALRKELATIHPEPVTQALLTKARALFTCTLDVPGGMRIQTIHGFCQTLLQRFAVEATVPANFNILDEQQAEELVHKALKTTLQNSSEAQNWLDLIHYYFKDQSFLDCLNDFLMQRSHLIQLQHFYPTLGDFEQRLREQFNLPDSWIASDPRLTQKIITQACQLTLITSVPESAPQLLADWLSASLEERAALFNQYCQLFLTKEGEISQRPKVKNAGEAERLYRVQQNLNTIQLAQKTVVILYFGMQIFTHYQHLKAQQNFLDYDDLIEKTLHLLQQPQISAWILYKLDGGIDHILVDEAQDTNPQQWQIIRLITEELFNEANNQRSLFVVGDGKQSIYSFQGANPRDFIDLQTFFSERLQATGLTWRQIELEVSFRSTPKILSLVDQVFAKGEHLGPMLVQQPLKHIPFRDSHIGHVSLWPAVIAEPDEKQEAVTEWQIPKERLSQQTVVRRFCEKLCQEILTILNHKQPLPSTNEAPKPKDILILVRQRGELMHELIRTLKRSQIPIMGADRFILNTHLIVQDLMALGQFLLLPADDLSLSCVLRSPLIGLSETDLEILALERPATLWQALKASSHSSHRSAYDYLQALLTLVDYEPAYTLYDTVLHKFKGRQQFATRFGVEATDVLNEFLKVVFDFQTQKQQSLQEFLSYLQQNQLTIKRDSNDETSNQIRIMTIHGAKGLQAPIVILAEKFSSSAPQDKLLWQLNSAGQCELVLARPSQRQDNAFTKSLKLQDQQNQTYENQRLLYVALTRAADHLYVCGYGSKVTPESWYQQIIDRVNPLMSDWQKSDSAPYMIKRAEVELPSWLTSSLEKKVPGFTSNTAPTLQTERMHRGVVIHKLFEMLGDIAPAARLEQGSHLLNLMKLEPSDWQSDLQHVVSMLEHPDYTPFFQNDSFAEMEVIHPDGSLLRLDRVIISAHTITILDYKTSEKAPTSTADIPVSIIKQLGRYYEALSSLYPAHDISSAILWTSIPLLQRVPQECLELNNTGA